MTKTHHSGTLTIAAFCAAWIASLLLSDAALAAAPAPQFVIEEGYFEVIDTGLEQGVNWHAIGAWYDDTHVLLNVLKARDSPKGYPIPDVVLYDISSKTYKTIFTNGTVHCYSPELDVFGVSLPSAPQEQTFARLEKSGEFRLLRKEEDPGLYSGICVPRVPKTKGHSITTLRPGHGYIDIGDAGMHGRKQNRAIFYRPGYPPQELPLWVEEFNGITYVPFLNKYILNDYDPAMFYEPMRPYVLMTPDGELSEVPRAIEAGQFLGHGHSTMRFMKPGYVVGATGPGKGERGLFLMRGNRLARIYGKHGDYFSLGVASPDGCKSAFTTFTISPIFGPSKFTLKIVDLCKEGRP